MMRFDLMKYGSRALVSYGAIVAYDVLMDGRTFQESFTMNDGAVFAVSAIGSEIAYELVSNVIPYINEGSVAGMIAKPLINGIVYSYMYNSLLNKSFPYYRDNMKAFYIGSIGNLLIGYFENPLLSLFGFRSYA